MVQGLPKNPQDQQLAEQWVDAKIAEAISLANGQWKPIPAAGRKFAPGQEEDLIRKQQTANPFYPKVQEAVSTAGTPEVLENDLKELRKNALQAMRDGKPPPGPMEAIMDAFSSAAGNIQNAFKIDPNDPVGSITGIPGKIMGAIMEAVKAAVMGIIMNYLGDSTAGMMKSMKNNYLDNFMRRMKGEQTYDITPEEATKQLERENAGQALAEAMGIKDKQAVAAIGQSVAAQLSGHDSSKNPAGGAAPANPSGTIPLSTAEQAKRAAAGTPAQPDKFNGPSGVVPNERPNTPQTKPAPAARTAEATAAGK